LPLLFALLGPLLPRCCSPLPFSLHIHSCTHRAPSPSPAQTITSPRSTSIQFCKPLSRPHVLPCSACISPADTTFESTRTSISRQYLPLFVLSPIVSLAASSHLSVLTSPMDSDLPVLSTSSSSMSHTSTSPSVSDPNDNYSYASSHQTSIPSSYLDGRRLSLTPLSIPHAPRYASPWSAVEPSASQHPLRRGSLPSHHPDYNTSQHRPLTAPQAHICTQQPNWSDQDDLVQFAYNAYTSPAEEPPLSAYSAFPSNYPSANLTGDYLLGPGHLEEPTRSRPSTRGEYPAYIPNCEETIHINTPQQFSVDPAAISAPITLDSPPEVKPSVECADFAQSGEDATNDTSRTLTPSPTSTRRRPSAPERRKASPIIETYKGGIVPPIKRRGKLPKATTELLKTWLYDHAQHPYPTEEEKKRLCAHTGLTFNQVSNWMINVRDVFPFEIH
jgi:hypothetical protein